MNIRGPGQKGGAQSDSLVAYHPYAPIFPMDPRHVDSVGDQVLSEHIFGFHSRAGLREGFSPVLSSIAIDRESGTITIAPLFPVKRSDGTSYSIDDLCRSLRESLSGTSHIPYKGLVKQVSCDGVKVVVSLVRVPVNIEFLFTLPDFSLFDGGLLPLSGKATIPSTGPYYLNSFKMGEVELRRNQHYPRELRANDIDLVYLRSYASTHTSELVSKVTSERDHFLYFFGHVLTDADSRLLESKGYRLDQYPSEWLVYLGFQPEVPKSDRITIGRTLDLIRQSLLSLAPRGQPAYSIAPSDRPWGLDEESYRQIVRLRHAQNSAHLSRSFTLGTLDHWASIPYFQGVLNALQEKFPELKLRIFPRAQVKEFYSSCDVFLSPLGIAPSDPLSHLSFLRNFIRIFQNSLPDRTLVEVAIEDRQQRFEELIRRLEKDFAEEGLIVPLAHFPGIVAASKYFEKDERLSWSWGIQPWTYHQH